MVVAAAAAAREDKKLDVASFISVIIDVIIKVKLCVWGVEFLGFFF